MQQIHLKLTTILILTLISSFFSSCGTTGSAYQKMQPKAQRRINLPPHPLLQSRNKKISQEPSGNHYIGRRYYIPHTKFWGYLRRPRESWTKARLVIFDESHKLAPDRHINGMMVGKDHNVEYRIHGKYINQTTYDPNSNLVLPIFLLTNHEVINPTPGFIFHPNEDTSGKLLPRLPGGQPTPF